MGKVLSAWSYFAEKGFFNWMSDESYLKKMYKYRTGKNLNLDYPKSFNEKLQWLKIHNKRDEYSNFVDKYEVKRILKDIIGEKHIIPTLGVWDKYEEIDYSLLPRQFVLKSTHDSGSVVICKDKDQFNEKKAREIIEKSLTYNFYWHGREWPYKNVKPRIIAEKYMQDSKDEDLKDYKVFVFNGEPFCVQVDYDRFTDHHRNFYTTEWEYMPFTTCYPTNPKHIVDRPEKLNLILDLSRKISKYLDSIPFVRVDFYVIDNEVYFGEVTFYHGNGFERFFPDEYDILLGNKIILGGEDV